MSHATSAKLFFAGLIVATLSQGHEARAQATPKKTQGTDTGCSEEALAYGYYLSNGRKAFDEERFRAFALRLNTPVYQEASGNARTARSLKFSERMQVIDPGDAVGRFKVADSNAKPVGWVARSDMLCRTLPMMAPGQTENYRRVIALTKEAYQTPERISSGRCEGTCGDVRQGQWYFVYAEDKDHYLISDSAVLAGTAAGLTGWIAKSAGQVWDIPIGLRPREDLATSLPERFVCAYRSIDDLRKDKGCKPIAGGAYWLSLSSRIAVLAQTPQAYEVLISTAGPDNKAIDGNIVAEAGNRFYIPVDDKVIPELLLWKNQLDLWIKTLNDLRSAGHATAAMPVRTRLRNALSDLRQTGAQTNGAGGKLLQYSDEELADANRVPACEIDYLMQYAAKEYDILNVIYLNNGRMLPSFTVTAAPENVCIFSEKGKSLPFFDGDIRPRALNRRGQETNYSVTYLRANEPFFWIPLSLLP